MKAMVGIAAVAGPIAVFWLLAPMGFAIQNHPVWEIAIGLALMATPGVTALLVIRMGLWMTAGAITAYLLLYIPVAALAAFLTTGWFV